MPRRPVLNYLPLDRQLMQPSIGRVPRWVLLGWVVLIAGGVLLLTLLLFPQLVLLFTSA